MDKEMLSISKFVRLRFSLFFGMILFAFFIAGCAGDKHGQVDR